jgi:hypothetical protein
VCSRSRANTKLDRGEMKVNRPDLSCIFSYTESARAHPSGVVKGASRTECERKSWYPKDGDLCRGRMKPEETLVKVRRDSDVQIDRLILA